MLCQQANFTGFAPPSGRPSLKHNMMMEVCTTPVGVGIHLDWEYIPNDNHLCNCKPRCSCGVCCLVSSSIESDTYRVLVCVIPGAHTHKGLWGTIFYWIWHLQSVNVCNTEGTHNGLWGTIFYWIWHMQSVSVYNTWYTHIRSYEELSTIESDICRVLVSIIPGTHTRGYEELFSIESDIYRILVCVIPGTHT